MILQSANHCNITKQYYYYIHWMIMSNIAYYNTHKYIKYYDEAIHQRCHQVYIYAYTPKNRGWYMYTNQRLGEYICTNLSIHTSCSLNSLVLHIGLHITSTESYWHYCYRRPKFPFHKLRSPFLVTNIRLLTPIHLVTLL